MILELIYSRIGASPKRIVQPAAERSAEASDNSNACSTFKSGKPSISKIRPEKTFFLPFFSTVNKPFSIAAKGIALTKSRKVMPACISPVKRTKTDSGISKGMTPVAAANATKPEPAGKEMPIGKRVCESPPVPTVSGNNIRFNQEWIIPSPGRRATPPRFIIKSGKLCCIATSMGFGYAAVWQKDCSTKSAEKPKQAKSFNSSRVIGPVVS
ncbi:hypothetical protein BAZMOX_16396_0 [methanotrophic endosymbiont of Bathymodiolus azoricus (Menez Gwen)]|nr:hypothetical protein BAZMOX_16396_0 [methanotrophic endosymbiont of Bathymodiolus azoricus (Menez Gwen)]